MDNNGTLKSSIRSIVGDLRRLGFEREAQEIENAVAVENGLVAQDWKAVQQMAARRIMEKTNGRPYVAA